MFLGPRREIRCGRAMTNVINKSSFLKISFSTQKFCIDMAQQSDTSDHCHRNMLYKTIFYFFLCTSGIKRRFFYLL